jgi:hypothetical protein
MNIKEIRQKYPQYGDISDGELAQALHRKYYSDMPYAQFEQKVFETKPVKIGAEALPEHVKVEAGSRGFGEQALAGAGTFLDNAAMRLKQAVTGLSPEDELQVKSNRAIASTPGGLVGNIAGNVAATGGFGAAAQAALAAKAAGALPAVIAPAVAAAATGGALATATNPVLQGESELANTGLGAAGGAAGDIAGRVLSRAVQPISQSAPVKKLLGDGVVPTPGQAAGANSIVGRVEQKLMSLPLVGDIIKKGRDRATEEFDIAAIRRALPTDAKGQITSAGRSAIEKADEILGSSYDDVYKGITVKPDTQFLRGVVGVKNDPDLALPKELQSRLGEVVKTQVLDRVKKGELSGPLAQRIDSNLGSIARRYASSQDADQRVLGIAIREVQKNFKQLVERNAGGDAAETIRELNRSYANFLRVERAASLKGAQDGVFTAEQLSSAVRALDRSSNKGSYAKGSALMQDLSDAGRSVLGNTVPNSGTADRLAMGLMAGAGGLGAANEYYGGPGYLTALAAAPLLYSRPGARYMVGDLPGQAGIARTLRDLSPYFAQSGRAIAGAQ